MLEIKPSELAQAILTLKGKPLNLDDYKPFETVYDLAPSTLTLCCGRQIGKSVSLGASIISNSILRNFFGTLFISPLAQQTSRFSSQYLAPFMLSPIVKNHFVGSSDKKNVFLRTFNNGSSVTLGYAETEQDADRIRGVSADCLNFDEVQDASLEAIPILEETLSASDYAFRRYTGTAKGEANTLTKLFKASNMMEWVVKCESCGKYSIPNEFEVCLKMLTVNEDGPGCYHCGALLNMKKGKWIAGRPMERDHIGMHIPQLCIPARTVTFPKNKWRDLVKKAVKYDTIKLSNEVFGLPVGAGGRPLSMREVMAVCNSSWKEFDKKFPGPDDPRRIITTVLGVDWSVTGSDKSYTVLSVLGYDFVGKAYLLYAERLEGIDILKQVERAVQIFRQFDCSHLASDRGVGVVQGQLMKRALGEDRVSMIQYVAAKTTLRYDRQGDFFAADRTTCIDTMIIKTKLGVGKLETPCWDIMETFWNDALHVYEEESISGRRLFRKDDDGTDDFLHSIVFANIGYMIIKGEFKYQDDEAVRDNIFTLEDLSL